MSSLLLAVIIITAIIFTIVISVGLTVVETIHQAICLDLIQISLTIIIYSDMLHCYAEDYYNVTSFVNYCSCCC